jgi:hypothetical protein
VQSAHEEQAGSDKAGGVGPDGLDGVSKHVLQCCWLPRAAEGSQPTNPGAAFRTTIATVRFAS